MQYADRLKYFSNKQHAFLERAQNMGSLCARTQNLGDYFLQRILDILKKSMLSKASLEAIKNTLFLLPLFSLHTKPQFVMTKDYLTSYQSCFCVLSFILYKP